MKRKIGILGGAFNPITRGHISIAVELTHKKELDEVWLMPSFNHPNGKVMVDFETRVRMIEDVLKIYGTDSRISVMTNEHTNKSGYTFDLVKSLFKIYPDVDFKLILGSDRADDIANDTWFKSKELKNMIEIITIDRTESVISSSAARSLIMKNTESRVMINSRDVNNLALHLHATTIETINELELYRI